MPPFPVKKKKEDTFALVVDRNLRLKARAEWDVSQVTKDCIIIRRVKCSIHINIGVVVFHLRPSACSTVDLKSKSLSMLLLCKRNCDMDE